jgi:hypothetical protein
LAHVVMLPDFRVLFKVQLTKTISDRFFTNGEFCQKLSKSAAKPMLGCK